MVLPMAGAPIRPRGWKPWGDASIVGIILSTSAIVALITVFCIVISLLQGQSIKSASSESPVMMVPTSAGADTAGADATRLRDLLAVDAARTA